MPGIDLFVPALHGALGWWDEIINLIPVVIGIVLVIYLYRANRARRRTTEAPPEAEPESSEAHAPRP